MAFSSDTKGGNIYQENLNICFHSSQVKMTILKDIFYIIGSTSRNSAQEV